MKDPCPASRSGTCLQLLEGWGFGVCPEDGVCDEEPDPDENEVGTGGRADG